MKRLKTLLKLLLVPLPIIYVIGKVDIGLFLKEAASVSLPLVASAFGILLVRIAVQSWRFAVLTKPFTDKITFSTLLNADLKAKYYSLIIPTSMGQDVVRGTLLRKHLTTDQIIGISLFFRLTGVLPLLILSLIGIVNFAGIAELKSTIPLLILSAILLILFSIALLSRRVSKWLGNHIRPHLPEKLQQFIRESITAVQLFKKEPLLNTTNILISTVSQLLLVSFSAVLLKTVTGSFHWLTAITFIPAIEIISILVPFGPHGFGIRELGYVALFKTINETSESRALFISLSLMMYFVILIGIFPIMWEKLQTLRRKDQK